MQRFENQRPERKLLLKVVLGGKGQRQGSLDPEPGPRDRERLSQAWRASRSHHGSRCEASQAPWDSRAALLRGEKQLLQGFPQPSERPRGFGSLHGPPLTSFYLSIPSPHGAKPVAFVEANFFLEFN